MHVEKWAGILHHSAWVIPSVGWLVTRDCGKKSTINRQCLRRDKKHYCCVRFLSITQCIVSVKIWSKTNKKTKARSQGLIARPNVLGETKVLRSTRPTYQLGPTNSAQYQDQLGPLSDQVGPIPSNTEDLAWDPSPHLTSIKCFLCFKFIDIFLCKMYFSGNNWSDDKVIFQVNSKVIWNNMAALR